MGLHLREVARSYGKGDNVFQALKPTTFGINPGTTVAIVGKSGSGKSTLLHLLVGLDHPTSGEVLFNGKNILKDYKTDSWRGENVGIVFQQFFLQAKDSVLENVALPLKIRGVSRKVRNKEAAQALDLVGLSDKAKSKANDLSGGQKQRVAIARAIVTKPALLVADEPTGNLDSENGEAVENLLFDLNRQLGTTLVIVTHDDDLAARCQRIIRLRDGVVIQDTAAKQRPGAPGTTAAAPAANPANRPARPMQPQPTTAKPLSPRPMPPKPTAATAGVMMSKPMQPLARPAARVRQLINGKSNGTGNTQSGPFGIPVIGGKTLMKPTPTVPNQKPIAVKRPVSKPVTVQNTEATEVREESVTVDANPPAKPVNHSARRKIL